MAYLFDRLRRGRGSIPASATFRITENGRDKLQEYSGDPKSRVLIALEARGTSDITEIAEASGMSKGQVERLLPTMVRGGYVQYVSAAIGGGDSY